MKHYLPSVHTIVAVLLVVVADKYFGVTDMAIAKLRGG